MALIFYCEIAINNESSKWQKNNKFAQSWYEKFNVDVKNKTYKSHRALVYLNILAHWCTCCIKIFGAQKFTSLLFHLRQYAQSSETRVLKIVLRASSRNALHPRKCWNKKVTRKNLHNYIICFLISTLLWY